MDLRPVLRGSLVELRPLEWGDWEKLFACASDPLVWAQHPESDRCTEPVFRAFFERGMSLGSAFAVVERSSGAIIGSTRYHGYDGARSEVEIGWSFLVRRCWGGSYNREMKRLMLDHAFGFVERVFLLIDETNGRSRSAAARLGARHVSTIEKIDGRGRAARQMRWEFVRGEWEGVRAAMMSGGGSA
ncbi:MAG: GNAT family N-acetyltransferase [Phycisphaerales bacterium]